MAVTAPIAAKHNPFASQHVNSVSFGTPTAEAANARTISLTFKGPKGRVARGAVNAYLASDAAGNAVIASAPSGGVAAGTDGLILPIIAGKYFTLVSEDTGEIDIVITEAGTATYYLVVILPNGKQVVSGAITFAA